MIKSGEILGHVSGTRTKPTKKTKRMIYTTDNQVNLSLELIIDTLTTHTFTHTRKNRRLKTWTKETTTKWNATANQLSS